MLFSTRVVALSLYRRGRNEPRTRFHRRTSRQCALGRCGRALRCLHDLKHLILHDTEFIMILALLLAHPAFASDINSFMELLPAAWSTASESYSTAFSPCLDGLVVNFRAAGCQLIADDPEVLGKGSVGLICVAPKVQTAYSLNEHVIFTTATHDVQDFHGWDVFCVDPNITMYIPEKLKLKPKK